MILVDPGIDGSELDTDLAGARLLFQFCDTPLDIEHRFGTTRRGTTHPSCSTGRMPIAGLYLAGGAVHPGVPVHWGAATTSPGSSPRTSAWSAGNPSPSYSEPSSSMAIEVGLRSLIGTMS